MRWLCKSIRVAGILFLILSTQGNAAQEQDQAIYYLLDEHTRFLPDHRIMMLRLAFFQLKQSQSKKGNIIANIIEKGLEALETYGENIFFRHEINEILERIEQLIRMGAEDAFESLEESAPYDRDSDDALFQHEYTLPEENHQFTPEEDNSGFAPSENIIAQPNPLDDYKSAITHRDRKSNPELIRSMENDFHQLFLNTTDFNFPYKSTCSSQQRITEPFGQPVTNHSDSCEYTEDQVKSYRMEYKQFTFENFDNPNTIKKLMKLTPDLDAIDSDKLPASKNLTLILSGGTIRPFSYPVAKNQAAFAKARKIDYRFITFFTEQNPAAKAVSQWLKDHSVKPHWGKVFLMNYFLKKLKPDEWLAWIDDDIIINDFSLEESSLDRVITHANQDVCVITMRDIFSISGFEATPNTGIVLARNSPRCQKIFELWLEGSSHHRYSNNSQVSCLQDQEYLEEMYYSGKTIEHNGEIQSLTSTIAILEPRTSQWNINTYKRFDHDTSQEARRYDHDFNKPLRVAASPCDAYVHHTGMAPLFRQALIAHTLWMIRDNYPL